MNEPKAEFREAVLAQLSRVFHNPNDVGWSGHSTGPAEGCYQCQLSASAAAEVWEDTELARTHPKTS